MLLPVRSRFLVLIFFVLAGVSFLIWARNDAFEFYERLRTSKTQPPVEHEPPPYATYEPPEKLVSEEGPMKQAWIEVAAATTVSVLWDPIPITEMCEKTTFWSNDVYYECHDSQGGLGNVRQDILACLRYAIDSGAGLIMPLITVRSEDVTDLKSGDKIGLEYLFDRTLFVQRLRAACPQMRIVESQAELERMAPVHTTILAPRDIQGQGNVTVLSINSELQRTRGPIGSITVVIFLITLAYFPVCIDPEPFVNQLGNLLVMRQDVSELAASALHELSTRFSLSINPSDPIPPLAYFGAHLRTSADAIAMGWPDYHTQSARYLTIAQEQKMPVLYVASGNLTSIGMLRDEASELSPPINVVTKHDLLTPSNREILKKLSWDQQALVDFLLLERSSIFCGLSESSFSWSLAIRRRVKTETGSCAPRDRTVDLPNQGDHSGLIEFTKVGTVYKDVYTDLLGRQTSEWEIAMWP